MIAPIDITLSGISKQYGAVTALRSVDFQLRPGCVHALVGENGAGKSTLMAIAFGLVRPDAGELRVNGRITSFRSPRDAVRVGLGMVQQHFSLVRAHTVAENVVAGGGGLYNPGIVAERVRSIAAQAGFELDPGAVVSSLSVQAQQRVEIVRALARGARALILDEPTAVLAPEEVAGLLEWIRGFARRGGAVALVTHRVREALQVADEVTVLRGGSVMATGPASHFTESSLARSMFPVGAPTLPPRMGSTAAGSLVVEATALAVRGEHKRLAVRDATFSLRRGEIVGLLGVEGAGHVELLQALAGVRPAAAGTLTIKGSVSYVPADRHRDAVVLEFSLFENLALRHIGERSGVMDWRAARRQSAVLLQTFDIRASSVAMPMHALSGGNQQRFVLGRELGANPDLLIAENPTRGLDLQATQFVHERLAQAAACGASVLMYSSDLDEVLAVAHRVLVVHRGILREVPGGRDAVGRALVGAT